MFGHERMQKQWVAHLAKGELEMHFRLHSWGNQAGVVLRACPRTASQDAVDFDWNLGRSDVAE